MDVANETPIWKSLWASVKPQVGTLPQIAIISDQKGEVFPLPTEAATLELLKRYAPK